MVSQREVLKQSTELRNVPNVIPDDSARKEWISLTALERMNIPEVVLTLGLSSSTPTPDQVMPFNDHRAVRQG